MTQLTLRNNKTPSLFGAINDVFGAPFFGTYLDEILDNVPVTRRRETSPAVNVSTTDEAYKISLACPGVEKDSLEIKIRENVLSVSHEQKENSGDAYFCSSFQRSWTLPMDVDQDEVSATYENGVFNVTIPRIVPVEPEVKKIEVK
jgi:HSP20 family protein